MTIISFIIWRRNEYINDESSLLSVCICTIFVYTNTVIKCNLYVYDVYLYICLNEFIL